jgi:hypothetical protein
MAGPNYVLDKGFLAGGAITKYHVVKLASPETVTAATAIADDILGVCQEEVTSGDATNGRIVDIRLAGISRCIAGTGGVTAGKQVMVLAGGTGRVTDAVGATARVLGIALQTATVGTHVDVLLTHGGVL